MSEIIGTSGNDSLVGTDENDSIFAGLGKDTLIGGPGDDLLSVREWNDEIQRDGDYQLDSLVGGAGNDTLLSAFGYNILFGDEGDDLLESGFGSGEAFWNIGQDTLYGGSGNDTLVGGLGLPLMYGEDGNDSIYVESSQYVSGGAGDDWVEIYKEGTVHGDDGNDTLDGSLTTNVALYGGSGNDLLIGGDRYNILDGGPGADTLYGGAGSNTYVIDDPGDVIIESATVGDPERINALHTYMSYTLGAGFQFLILLGEENLTGTGNELDNLILGNHGDDTLTGLDGNDTLRGSRGSDLINGDAGDDSLEGGDQEDTLLGGMGQDSLRGDDEDDLLDGGSGDDSLDGGRDQDTLLGGDGDDTLIGGPGADVMEGGAGNDLYRVDDPRDQVIEDDDAGYDRVEASTDYFIAPGIEELYLIGPAILGSGNAQDNYIQASVYSVSMLNGMAGNDTLIGSTGANTLLGGSGDDLLKGGENGTGYLYGGEGNDIATGGHYRDYIYGGAGNDTLSSSDQDDIIHGEEGDDQLDGENGDDELLGGAGNDVLTGGSGDDTLDGGTGADTLYGGTGGDTFIIDNLNDVIADTEFTHDDKVILRVAGYDVPAGLNNVVYESTPSLLPYWLDALIAGEYWGAVGQPVTLTIGFPLTPPGGDTSGYESFEPFQNTHQDKVWEVLELWREVSGLTFLPSSYAENADIQFAFFDLPDPLAGSANFPNPQGSLVAIDTDGIENSFEDDRWYHVLVHEIGHALGLKHPGDYGNNDNPPFLPVSEDSIDVTQLSYIESGGNHPDGVNPNRILGPYDIAAAQYLYGVNPGLNAGDTVYDFHKLSWPGSMIGDAGGLDTLDASIEWTYVDLTLDLREGSMSHWGQPSSVFSGGEQVTINYGSIIENAIGSAGDDRITGNAFANFLSGQWGIDSLEGLAGNDTLVGGPDNDILSGGDGIDVAVFQRDLENYALVISEDETIVASFQSLGITTDGTDQLFDIERLEFSDTYVALDLAGNAGEVAKLLGAVLGPEHWNNKEYLGIGIDFLDNSGFGILDLTQIAFQVLLGNSPSNGDVVNLLYSSIVGAAPPADFYDAYVAMMDAGEFTQAELGVAAANHEINLQNIDFVGLAQSGLEYQPLF